MHRRVPCSTPADNVHTLPVVAPCHKCTALQNCHSMLALTLKTIVTSNLYGGITGGATGQRPLVFEQFLHKHYPHCSPSRLPTAWQAATFGCLVIHHALQTACPSHSATHMKPRHSVHPLANSRPFPYYHHQSITVHTASIR